MDESSPCTLSKINLPRTPLIAYIPDIIKQFRPKYKNKLDESLDIQSALADWLKFTQQSVHNGLEKSLNLVTSVKGLHIIREEALKIG